VDCHGDPHVGQFRDQSGKVDCARCHSTDGAFARADVDHDRDTRFMLDQDHVRLDPDASVKVTLVEGVVKVARVAPGPMRAPDPAPAQQVMLTAGEELRADHAAPMSVRPADVAAQTSWKAGLVVFKSAPLAEAVAEVNRYTDRPLTIADPSIAGYRVTGVFRTGEPDRFAHAVTEILPVKLEAGKGGAMVLVRAEPAGAG